MALDLDRMLIASEEKQAIQNKSPASSLPLNPTAQGWSGQAVRRQLSSYVTDDTDSVMALLEEKMDVVSEYTGYLENLSQGALDVLNVRYIEDIEEGDLLQFRGTIGSSGKLLVGKTILDNSEDSVQVHPELLVGIALESGSQNEEKDIMIGGVYVGLDTSNYQEQAILYIDPINSGGMTNQEPNPPKNRNPIAVTIYSHQNNGIIIYRPTFYPDMAHIQDVDLTGLQNRYVLKYDSATKTWKPGLSQGIFYDDDLPDIEERYPNLTWFNESEE